MNDTEWGSDLFDFTAMTTQEQRQASHLLFRGDVDDSNQDARQRIEEATMWGRVAYDKSVGNAPFAHVDSSVFGGINAQWAVMLTREGGTRDKYGIDTHIAQHRIHLKTQEATDYASQLNQAFIRCKTQSAINKLVADELSIIKGRKDREIQSALNGVLRATKHFYDGLPDTLEADPGPDMQAHEERMIGNGTWSAKCESRDHVSVVPTVENDEPVYRLYRYNVHNAKKVGWKRTPFTCTCAKDAVPSVVMDETGTLCTIVTYESKEVALLYRVPVEAAKADVSAERVPLQQAPVQYDTSKDTTTAAYLQWLAPLLCHTSSDKQTTAIGYGNSVAVLDENHVYYHHISPPASFFEQMITAVCLVGQRLYLGTRCGHVWIVPDFRSTTTKPTIAYVLPTITPVRQITHCPSLTPKIYIATINTISYVDGPSFMVRSVEHTGRSIQMDRPIALSARGGLIYALSKAGHVRLACIDPEANQPPVGTDMLLPATQRECHTYHMVPWYNGICCTDDRTYVLYPDGVIRIWFAVYSNS